MRDRALGGLLRHTGRVDRKIRDVLVMVVGRTPAVVTETLWALRHSPDIEVVTPDEIYLVVTKGVQREVLRRLTDSRDGGLVQLARDERVEFPNPVLVPVKDRDGREIEDILTDSDSIAVADTLVATFAALVSQPDTRVHASIAGGRKTMSFFVGYILSLLARPGDELSHVLVDPDDFEECENFWYPMPVAQFADPARRRVRSKTGLVLDAADAKLRFGLVPIVPLGDYISATELEFLRSKGYSAVINRLRQRLASPKVRVDARKRTLSTGGSEISLSPQSFAMWWLYARCAIRGHKVAISDFTTASAPLAREYARLRALAKRPHDDETYLEEEANKYLRSMDGALFSGVRGRLQNDLKAVLKDDVALLKRLLPRTDNDPGGLGLNLDRDDIELVELDEVWSTRE